MTDPNPTGAEAFSSVHTAGYAPLLRELGCTLLATTFQAGRLILIRPQGATLNTHFHALPRPMGLAADVERIFVGGQRGVHEFRNVPAVARKLSPPDAHDAVYLLRNVHITGHVDIHEMAFAGSECWYVNTLFSYLCTLDREHSFVPRCSARSAGARDGGPASAKRRLLRLADPGRPNRPSIGASSIRLHAGLLDHRLPARDFAHDQRAERVGCRRRGFRAFRIEPGLEFRRLQRPADLRV